MTSPPSASPAGPATQAMASDSITVKIPDLEQVQRISLSLQKFQASFATRVRNRDYSNPWNECFTRLSGEAYRAARVAALRNHPVMPVDYNRRPIVVLDLGHGHEVPTSIGYDTGGTIKGLKETQVIDAVGTALKQSLEEELGALVILTREPIKEGITLKGGTSKFDNQESALQKRAEMTSTLVGDFPGSPVLFVSLHGNKSPASKSAGGIVYYYSDNLDGPTDSPESQNLARNISAHYQLRAGTNTKAEGNDYGVLRCQFKTTPAVLVELGFLTNPNDARTFHAAIDNPYRAEEIASGIVNGMRSYISSKRTAYMVASVDPN